MDIVKKDLVEMVEVDVLAQIHDRRKQVETRLKEIEESYGDDYCPAMKALDDLEKERVKGIYLPQFEALIGKITSVSVSSCWNYREKDRCEQNPTYVPLNKHNPRYYQAKPIGATLTLSFSSETFQGSLKIPADKTYFKEAMKILKKREGTLKEAEGLVKEFNELKQTERDLPNKLKAFSAALSRKALNSTPKGIKIIQLLNDLQKNTSVDL
jgi:hypothetical protein